MCWLWLVVGLVTRLGGLLCDCFFGCFMVVFAIVNSVAALRLIYRWIDICAYLLVWGCCYRRWLFG